MESIFGANVNNDFSVINMKSLLIHNLTMLRKHAEAARWALDVIKFLNEENAKMFFAEFPELSDSVITCAVALDLNGDPEGAIIVLDRAKDLIGEEANLAPFDELISMIKKREKNKLGLKKVVEKFD
jgi:hypothetical protein